MNQNVVIILASESPRRRELLQQAGLEFQIITSEIEEKTKEKAPEKVVLELSDMKCKTVADIFIRKTPKNDSMDLYNMLIPEDGGILVISADTVVAYEGTILGKPKDPAEAKKYLMMLSGNTHEVYTGVNCRYLTYSSYLEKMIEADNFGFYSKTLVKMYPFDEYEALDYIATGEPMDKAGAYGIQGIGSRLVESINGDYNNVVGLPLSQLIKELSEREYLTYN